MKKTIQIVGIGQRKVGISAKTKQPYDFTEVSIVFDDKNFTGQKAETIAFDQDILDHIKLEVGGIYEAEIFSMNFKTRIACIYG